MVMKFPTFCFEQEEGGTSGKVPRNFPTNFPEKFCTIWISLENSEIFRWIVSTRRGQTPSKMKAKSAWKLTDFIPRKSGSCRAIPQALDKKK